MKLLHRGQLFLLFALLSVLAACRADTPTDSTSEPSRPDDSVYTSEWQNRFFYTPLGLSIYLDAPIYTYEAASEAASDNAVWDAAHQLGRRLMEDLAEWNPDEIEFVGLCTDICVVSNVLGTKAWLPETLLTVDSSCCAGVTPESHEAALATMRSCQVNVI